MNNTRLFLLWFIMLFSLIAKANLDSLVNPQVRTSPTMIANMVLANNNYVKVTYGQPFKKNRTVFGGLVPFGQIWRTGANEATEITTNFDFKINQINFIAGTYSIFTIPEQATWKVILSKKIGQWGAYDYNQADDITRYDSDVVKINDIYESFTIEIHEKNSLNLDLNFLWDNTKVILPIQINEKQVITTEKKKKKRKSK